MTTYPARLRRFRALVVTGAAAMALTSLPSASAAEKPASGPLPVTGPDTVQVAGGSGYVTYGASTRAPRKVCGRFKAMSTAKVKKNCWVPYVAHGRGAHVGMARTVTGDAMPAGPGRWATRTVGLWAPSVTRYGGTYYLFYTATQRGTGKPHERGRKCVGVAVSKKARGPFHARPKPLLCNKGGWSIDASAFTGASKRKPFYVAYRDDAATTGYQTAISVARLNHDATRVLAKKRVLTSADITWERHVKKNEHDSHIVENPSMVWTAGRWWLFYSGNTWQTPKYATGVARCGTNPMTRCVPVPGPARPYFGYRGPGGLHGDHAPVAGLPRNKKAPGGLAVFRAHDGTLRAVWNYQTFPRKGRSARYSLVGKLHFDHGRWRVTEE